MTAFGFWYVRTHVHGSSMIYSTATSTNKVVFKEWFREAIPPFEILKGVTFLR